MKNPCYTQRLAQFVEYPTFPFNSAEYVLHDYIKSIKCEKVLAIINELREQAKDAINIEEDTTNQAQNPNWFKYRQSRFTASLCNKIGDISKKN